MKHHLIGSCAALAVALFLLSACSAGSPAPAPAAEPTAEPAQESAGGLTIPLSGLTSTVQFFDCAVDGIAMQVIALLDSDGTPRLAYNTCQVCAGSPRAFFEPKSGYLICQNCGNAFRPESVGRVSGGCNPMPVTDYETTADSVIISAESLAAVAPQFRNWKAGQ